MCVRWFYLFFIFFCLILAPFKGQSQSDSLGNNSYEEEVISDKKHFSAEEWEKAKNGIVYESEKEKEPDKAETPIPSSPFNFELLKYPFFILVFIVVVGFIAWLVQRVNATGPIARQDAMEISLSENLTKDELLLLDLENSISNAIRDKDFYLATRLLYLKVLQQLIGKGIIEWRKDQTNRTILFQLQNLTERQKVKLIFRQYESVWYGQKNIPEPDFQLYYNQCEELGSALQVAGK